MAPRAGARPRPNHPRSAVVPDASRNLCDPSCSCWRSHRRAFPASLRAAMIQGQLRRARAEQAEQVEQVEWAGRPTAMERSSSTIAMRATRATFAYMSTAAQRWQLAVIKLVSYAPTTAPDRTADPSPERQKTAQTLSACLRARLVGRPPRAAQPRAAGRTTFSVENVEPCSEAVYNAARGPGRTIGDSNRHGRPCAK